MKKRLLMLCCLFAASPLLRAQGHEVWTAFWNRDTTLVGFKDTHGNVRITPKFSGLTVANRFEDIIAVSEDMPDQHWKTYYLTRSGRVVGRDSLYMFDNTSDCEKEGFIRFRDRKTDKAGLFNRRGDIAVPAEYNDLSPVANGLIMALKGATKRMLDGGEHFSWEGGREVLIDTANRLLVDSFKYNSDLDLYSVQRSAQPSTDALRESFRGTDGQYYSFENTNTAFIAWLKILLAGTLTEERLAAATGAEVYYWKQPDGWVSKTGAQFVKDNFTLLQMKFTQQLDVSDPSNGPLSEGLNPYIFESSRWQQYFDNCGQPLEAKYPYKLMLINSNTKGDEWQDHFGFLRTDGGYKLVYVALGRGVIR